MEKTVDLGEIEGIKITKNGGNTKISLDTDATPTQNSTKPVTSGGVYDSVAGVSQEVSNLSGTVNNLSGTVSGLSSDVSGLSSSISGLSGTVNSLSGSVSGLSTDVSNLSSSAMKKGVDYVTTGMLSGSTLGYNATIEGNYNVASGQRAHAEGMKCSATGDYSHAEGGNNSSVDGNLASGIFSHAEGERTTASNESSHSEGYCTSASGVDSHAEGSSTIASGPQSHTEGYNTVASNTNCHAEGNATSATYYNCHAEGLKSVSNGHTSHAEGNATSALANYSHAEGNASYISTAGTSAHAEGNATSASGSYAHSEGNRTYASAQSHAEGGNTRAYGESSHAEGYETTTTFNGKYSHSEGYGTCADNYYSHAMGKYNVMSDASILFAIGYGTSAVRTNVFSVTKEGVVKAASTITASTTADYAEFFEWEDQNPNNEDRVGYFITFADGNKVRIANPDDEYILGVASGEPFVLGNGDCDTWNGMVLRDEFRRVITEPAPKMIVDEETGGLVEAKDENGNPIYEGVRPAINPEYDNTRKYINRKDRPEWVPVGMLGVLAVRDDGTCEVNSYCTIGEGGIATKAIKSDTFKYRVIKRNSENVVEIVFR